MTEGSRTAARTESAEKRGAALPGATTDVRQPTPLTDFVLGLQRTAGNQAVARLFDRRAAALLQRVLIGGVDVKNDAGGNNLKIFETALDYILFLQEDLLGQPDSWLSDVDAINAELQTNGFTPGAKLMIEKLYAEVKELSFVSNPVLAEAWQRCLNATKNKANYAAAGGKFKDKLPEVLHEIGTDFPTLEPKCKKIRVPNINKEHMVNKGPKFGGPQTAPHNLMYAGVPPVGGSGSLSEFHKGLHALKSGTGKVDYNALHPAIQTIIEHAQKSYDPAAIGTFK
jgi:hypothetical protein